MYKDSVFHWLSSRDCDNYVMNEFGELWKHICISRHKKSRSLTNKKYLLHIYMLYKQSKSCIIEHFYKISSAC